MLFDLTLTFKDSAAYGAESGIVILKKIPKGQQKNKHKGEESAIPDFKPLKSDESDEFTFKNIVGKLFHASTSLQPDEPTLEPDSTDNDDVEVESPKDYVEIEAPSKPAPVVYNSDDDSPPVKPSASTYLLNKKPNTFETVNYDTHPELYEPGTHSPETETSNPFKLSQAELDFLKNYFLKHKNNESHIPNNLSNTPVVQSHTSKLKLKPEDVSNIQSFPSYPGELPAEFITKYGQKFHLSPHKDHQFNSPPNPFDEVRTNHFDPRYKRYPISHPKHNIRFAPPQKLRPIRPPSKHFPFPPPHKMKSQSPPVNLVKSVTYQLTPNGPIKV